MKPMLYAAGALCTLAAVAYIVNLVIENNVLKTQINNLLPKPAQKRIGFV